jgi:hypothetical protein
LSPPREASGRERVEDGQAPAGSVLDSYLLAAEQGRWRILGDVVHA